jgi:TRAP-type C4-dicarboxylate transport system substrate-binding protein
MDTLKAYEVAKYASMTFHNYGPTVNVMNIGIWNGLTPEQQKLVLDLSREAQGKIRQATESVDNLDKAKELLGPKGMQVNAAELDGFRELAQKRVWPAYKSQYGELWDVIEKT